MTQSITAPRIGDELEPAGLPRHAFSDDGLLRGLSYEGADLAEAGIRLLDVEGCRFQSTNLGGGSWKKASFADCVFDDCDLANTTVEGSSMHRCLVTGSRITGLALGGCTLRHVEFVDCVADLAAFRASVLRDVRFTRCRLRQGDFYEADLTGAEFVDCDLTGAQFAHATMEGARLCDCDLSAIGGVESLAGATVSAEDVLPLTFSMAAALGINLATPREGAGAQRNTTVRLPLSRIRDSECQRTARESTWDSTS